MSADIQIKLSKHYKHTDTTRVQSQGNCKNSASESAEKNTVSLKRSTLKISVQVTYLLASEL